MADKEKRKTNPRRRLLIWLIIGIAIFGAIISAGYYALSPKGAQIVFIAPDDNGVDNIWIADLNDPEHPRQLTFHEKTDFRIYREHSFNSRPQAQNGLLVENGVIIYMNIATEDSGIWLLDAKTKEYELIRNACSNLMFHPDGEWIACEEYVRIDDNGGGLGGLYRLSIVVENLTTHEKRVIHEAEVESGEYSAYYLVSWIPGTTSIAYFVTDDTDSLPVINLYDMEENRLIGTRDFYASGRETIFSNDASHFVQHYDLYVGMDLTLFVNDFNNPDNILYDFIESSSIGDLTMTYFHDWHPDNETLLMSNVWYQADTDSRIHQLLLYNITTGNSDILSTREDIMYTSALFNNDATEILIGLQDKQSYENQLMIYDMETREEIALPLFGHSPQWVNGECHAR